MQTIDKGATVEREKRERKMLEAIGIGFLLGTSVYLIAFVVKQPSPWYMTHREFVSKLAKKGTK